MFQSEEWGAAARKGFQRRRRAQTDSLERRAKKAESLVLMGEVSAGRHALEGAPLAPGTQRTLDQLRDPVKRPTVPYAPLLEPMLHHQAERPFELDKTMFPKNLKRARRGAAAGPSGVTTEHLKAVLSHSRDAERLFTAGLLLAQARIPGDSDGTSNGSGHDASKAKWERPRHRGQRRVQEIGREDDGTAARARD